MYKNVSRRQQSNLNCTTDRLSADYKPDRRELKKQKRIKRNRMSRDLSTLPTSKYQMKRNGQLVGCILN